MKDKLPNKLECMIAKALQDLRKCEESEEHEVDMDVWYEKFDKCKVCFAGSTLAQTYGYNETYRTGLSIPTKFRRSSTLMRKLESLDYVRQGFIYNAFMNLPPEYRPQLFPDLRDKILNIEDEFAIQHLSYEKDRDTWMAMMEKLVSELKKLNLIYNNQDNG